MRTSPAANILHPGENLRTRAETLSFSLGHFYANLYENDSKRWSMMDTASVLVYQVTHTTFSKPGVTPHVTSFMQETSASLSLPDTRIRFPVRADVSKQTNNEKKYQHRQERK